MAFDGGLDEGDRRTAGGGGVRVEEYPPPLDAEPGSAVLEVAAPEDAGERGDSGRGDGTRQDGAPPPLDEEPAETAAAVHGATEGTTHPPGADAAFPVEDAVGDRPDDPVAGGTVEEPGGPGSDGSARPEPRAPLDSLAPERARAIVERATEVPGGLGLFDAGDPTLEAARQLPEFPGTQKYDLHGCPDGVIVPGVGLLGPKAFAEVVRADGAWNGKPITLFSCETGQARPDGGSFAQDLANELGVAVTAPTELAWSSGGDFYSTSGSYDASGQLQPDGPPWNGQFQTFAPQAR